MAEKEYTELQLKARDAGIKSWHVKSDDVLAEELAAKWAMPTNDDDREEVISEKTVTSTTPVRSAPPPPAAKVVEPKAKGKVTFFWKDRRNIEFTIETQPATANSVRQAVSFASKDSVLILDPEKSVEAKAIEKLRKSPKYKIDFDEIDNRNQAPAKKGAKLDELMALDHAVLVQMVGGSVQDYRKTKGELITQIMG